MIEPTVFPLPDDGFPSLSGPAPMSGESVMDRSWLDCRSRLSSLRELARALKDRGAERQEKVRTELVQRVRRTIADGTYDTPERWEAALDRLAECLLLS